MRAMFDGNMPNPFTPFQALLQQSLLFHRIYNLFVKMSALRIKAEPYFWGYITLAPNFVAEKEQRGRCAYEFSCTFASSMAW